MFDHALHFCFDNRTIVAQYLTQHKPDFVSCIRGGLLHQVHTYSICSAYAVHVWYRSGTESAQTVHAFTQKSILIRGCLPRTTFIHYFDFKYKHCY